MAGRSAVRPLGEILVGRELITSSQLENALREQESTHKRLGTVLVSGGTISAPELTDALVEQIRKISSPPEFVWTRGFRGRVGWARRPRLAAGLQGARGHLPELTIDLARRARSAPARRSQASDVRRTAPASVTPEQVDIRAGLKRTGEVVVTQGAQITELLARVSEIAERLATLQALTVQRRGAEEAAMSPQVAPPDEPAAADGQSAGFLLFKPSGSDGYELVERDGEAPLAGQACEIDDRRFTVTRLGPSPLPADTRACAYLQAE